jgi:EAL domain-containing protein (putative c-di-GMP-specific phosphodiesterase class I)
MREQNSLVTMPPTSQLENACSIGENHDQVSGDGSPHILRAVRNALSNAQLELYYQPKIALRDHTHGGFEALLRWKKQDGHVLLPGSFMAALDDPSLSMAIGDHVISLAIAQARRWMLDCVPFVSVAINLSASQFTDPELAKRILNRIAASNLNPAMIEVEVTEGVFLSAKTEGVLNVCKILKQGGVRIAFDDFGTGFASLTHLRDFPVDTIKIDRSFVYQLGRRHNTTVIVNAMVGLAHNLSMSIVAEGVETQAQAEFLRAISCDAAQGYFFARPVPACEAAERLQASYQRADLG